MGKKITMTDIANECGVSQTLVSFVIAGKDHGISETTRRTVLETASRMGYKPSGRAGLRTVGIICDREYTALSLSVLLAAIHSTLGECGYGMSFMGCTEEYEGKREKMSQLGAVGFIIISTKRSFLSELSESPLLFTFIKAVSRDDEKCGVEAAREMVDICEGKADSPSSTSVESADIPGARGSRRESVWLL